MDQTLSASPVLGLLRERETIFDLSVRMRSERTDIGFNSMKECP